MSPALLIASTSIYSILIGVIPVLFWLWFWLKEDPHPEPRKILILVFFAGVAAVPIALLLEELVYKIFSDIFGLVQIENLPLLALFTILFFWAAVEEITKYWGAKWAALSKRSFDEPVDALVYLITAALGFAAFENFLFLFKAFGEGTSLGILTGEMRFLGATLLHTISSAIVGLSIAFSFFHKEHKRRNVLGGLILATLLHGIFNFSIIKMGGGGIILIFFLLWVAAIALIFFFEKIKHLRPETKQLTE